MASSVESPIVPGLNVRTADGRSRRFERPFRIGRAASCGVCIDGPHVSREHAEVAFADGHWWLRDLASANGLFVDGRRVTNVRIDRPVEAGLGSEAPIVTLAVEHVENRGAPLRASALSPDGHLPLEADSSEPAGRRTQMFLEAVKDLQSRQRVYRWGVAVAVLLAVAAAGYALYLRHRVTAQQALAEQLFYQMKSLDVQIASMERSLEESGVRVGAQVTSYLERRQQMERNYEQFLAGLNVRGGKTTEQERLILKVTRLLGECDVAAPPGYVGEVSRYIKHWQSTGRFSRAVALARERGYTARIVKEFAAEGLPPQFFYLAMQESGFDAFASGTPTSWGIAKGMWQFIPETGRQYGLAIGPLVALPRPDPLDDRHDWQKATRAAARYIKFIYSTDAQASGLLVMASYNWGERRVINLLRTMPANPQERNFWQVLEKHRDHIVDETYNYVFSIVAAAVIGENPRLFGFPFDNPLVTAETQPPAPSR